MNEVIINLEGKEYQIDIQKAKELGVLKEKDSRCKSWEEFKNKYKDKRGFFYNDYNDVIDKIINPIMTGEQLTENEAIAIKSFSKLLKLRRDWIGDWEPDWSNIYIHKYSIVCIQNNIKIDKFYSISKLFTFPTYEMAEEFLKCFEYLFVQCKCLI